MASARDMELVWQLLAASSILAGIASAQNAQINVQPIRGVPSNQLIATSQIGGIFPNPLDPNFMNQCDWAKNYTSVSQVPDQRVQALEECVWYYLREEATKKYGVGNRGLGALIEYPPPNSDGTIRVLVHGVVIKELNVVEEFKHSDMAGYISMSWLDGRLKWDTQKFLYDQININGINDIWKPDAKPSIGPIVLYPGDVRSLNMYFGDVKVRNTGNVTAKGQFFDHDIKTCNFDYKNYPDDTLTCCIYFTTEMFASNIRFQVLNQVGQMHPTWSATKWDVKEVKVDINIDQDVKDKEQLRVCIAAERQSSTLRIELSMPMAFSAILVLIAPLFRGLKAQLFVKLFAMLLQFMCFELLVQRTPHLGLGNDTPKVYTFYEFSMACTIVSLIFTLIIYACSDQSRTMPPPYKLTLFAAAMNRILCCTRALGVKDVSVEYKRHENGVLENGSATHLASPTSTVDDWRQLYIALNTVLSIVLVIVYIIGIIIIAEA